MNNSELEQLADDLIAHTRKKPEQFFDWHKLATRFKVDRDQLEKAASIAADWDYILHVKKNLGVAFVSAPDSLTVTEIEYNLKTKWLGCDLFSYRSVRSTNIIAARMATAGAVDGTIITAEEQTGGRGRLGRVWHSPPGCGVYMSAIVRPKIKPEHAPGISIMTAVALADTICKYLPGIVQIKWPNDVYINGRKTAGILMELSAEKTRINHLIIGIGININHKTSDWPDELRDIATSLRRELNHEVSRVEFLQLFLRNLEKEYESYVRHRLKKAHARIKRYSLLIGSKVTIRSGRNAINGLAIDIDTDGCLIIKTESGLRTISAGEVTVVRE